jgi:N-acetylglucosaminyl-diphospho-decaprenol L-rhamnosyltransferase
MGVAMDLSIIIVSWNTSGLLHECLNSIYDTNSHFSFEVIVVDNGSGDDSVSMVEECFPSVILLKNGKNLGFACANNQGLDIGLGRYFLLLNSDTIVLPGAIDALVEAANQHLDVGVLGPKLLNMNGTLQKSWSSFPSFLSELVGRNFRIRRPVPDVPNMYDVDWIMGACMLVRADTIQDVGKMDEDYFFYSEETDWCFRIKKKNWKVWYLASAEIYHRGGGSTDRGSTAQLVRLYQGKLLYFQKNHGSLVTTLLRLGLALSNGLGILRRLILINWLDREASFQRVVNQSKLVWYLLINQYPKTN